MGRFSYFSRFYSWWLSISELDIVSKVPWTLAFPADLWIHDLIRKNLMILHYDYFCDAALFIKYPIVLVRFFLLENYNHYWSSCFYWMFRYCFLGISSLFRRHSIVKDTMFYSRGDQRSFIIDLLTFFPWLLIDKWQNVLKKLYGNKTFYLPNDIYFEKNEVILLSTDNRCHNFTKRRNRGIGRP